MWTFLRKTSGSRPLRGADGYTAIEMVTAMSIFGILILSATGLYKLTTRALWQVDEKFKLERAAIFCMEQVTQDVRQAVSVVRLGPMTPAATTIIQGQSYTGGTSYALLPLTTLHLDSPATVNTNGTLECRIRIPNLTDPLQRTNDATLRYFLRRTSTGSVKLYKQMVYYNGVPTQALPVLVSTDRYRAGKPVATPGVEPSAGTPAVTYGALTPLPTPVGYDNRFGKLPKLYDNPDITFEDVSFLYDRTNSMLAIGLTLSVKSKGMSWFKDKNNTRRYKSITSTVALRRSN